MKTNRKVYIGKRHIKNIDKLAESLNLTQFEIIDKIITDWINCHDEKYSISVPDTFIYRSIQISESNWTSISNIAKSRNKPGTRFFAIIIDEWMSKYCLDKNSVL